MKSFLPVIGEFFKLFAIFPGRNRARSRRKAMFSISPSQMKADAKRHSVETY
jgi:hypothetical protein